VASLSAAGEAPGGATVPNPAIARGAPWGLPDLPIVEILDDVRAALGTPGRAVVAAPPGAGKTTVVPLALLGESWLGGQRIVMLEPRRLATRAAARRMAALTATTVGDLVGYQTRDERHIGPATRIEVVTEGVLTRRLQQDPELRGVGLVIFDEVHERNLTTDLGLAFTLETASARRPDLRIVTMSATADNAVFARLLSAPVIESVGRTFPIDVRWLPRPREQRIEEAAANAVRRALRDETGDVLVFLPGIGEISRLAGQLDTGPDVDVHRLAGALPVEEQDRALAPSTPGRRRVVLATDIAETSLTVEGIRVVVDSGMARAPRFQAGSAMTRLTTVAISRDSAEQRTGRAGRVEPGVAYRLWSRIEHGTRPAHRAAEITQVDLAGFALEVAAWGTPEDRLAFVDPPPRKTSRQAATLLRELGALDEDGTITELGRAMVALPVHPRLARMVVARSDALSCAVAAVIEERDVVRGDRLPADITVRVAAVCGLARDDRVDRWAAARVQERAADIARRAGVGFDPGAVDPDRSGEALLAGFPDRVARRRRPGQFELRDGTPLWLAADDPLATAPSVVVVDTDGRRSGARIRLAAAL
jgi:ATP-dependent RNA helicase HrpB